MDEEFYRKQRELMTTVISESDVVITTAAVPGRPSPVLVTAEMVAAMKPGSVIVDIAAERGGNCELTVAGETVVKEGVTILGPTNIASSLAHTASQLYSRNIATFLLSMATDGELIVNREDEVVAATLVAADGEVPDIDLAKRLGVSE